MDLFQNNDYLLFDGAMGTYLEEKYEGGVNRCELNNIRHPERVVAAHREYIAAGARAIKTNTFSANTFSLGEDLETVLRIIDAGCACAREAAEEDTLVFASMGPILHDDQKRCDSERRQAGRLFGQMQGTEFFDRLVSGSSDIAEKITGLMDYYLSPPFPTAGNAEAAAAAPYIATDAPDGLAGFDIRDFV